MFSGSSQSHLLASREPYAYFLHWPTSGQVYQVESKDLKAKHFCGHEDSQGLTVKDKQVSPVTSLHPFWREVPPHFFGTIEKHRKY